MEVGSVRSINCLSMDFLKSWDAQDFLSLASTGDICWDLLWWAAGFDVNAGNSKVVFSSHLHQTWTRRCVRLVCPWNVVKNMPGRFIVGGDEIWSWRSRVRVCRKGPGGTYTRRRVMDLCQMSGIQTIIRHLLKTVRMSQCSSTNECVPKDGVFKASFSNAALYWGCSLLRWYWSRRVAFKHRLFFPPGECLSYPGEAEFLGSEAEELWDKWFTRILTAKWEVRQPRCAGQIKLRDQCLPTFSRAFRWTVSWLR